jgi:hypothetical protein
MTMCLLFLVTFGGGTWSLDAQLRGKKPGENQSRIRDLPPAEKTD